MSALKNNPLLVKEGLPRYDEIEPNHIVPGVKQMLSEAEKQITALEQNMTPSWDGVARPARRTRRALFLMPGDPWAICSA